MYKLFSQLLIKGAILKSIIYILLLVTAIFAEVEFQGDGRNSVVIVNLKDTTGELIGKILFATNGHKTTGVTTLPIKNRSLIINVDGTEFKFPVRTTKGDVYKFSSKSTVRDVIYLFI